MLWICFVKGSRVMFHRSAVVLFIGLSLAGCVTTSNENASVVADAVDPSLRAAATTAEANHDYKGAIQHLNTLFQRHGDDKGIGLALARNLRYADQAQTGADVMQSLLTRYPNDPELLIELGKDYLAADRAALAIKTLYRARDVAPQRWDVYSTLGVALDTDGHSAEALQAFAHAAELSPDNPAVLNNLALAQAVTGHLDQAIATMSQAADLPSANMLVRQNLALLLALKGDAAKAEKLARRDLPPDIAKSNIEILRALAAAPKQ